MNRYPSGAPIPPPVWQLLCEFANGACVCAHMEKAGPCEAVRVTEDRIRNRLAAESSETRRASRRARP